MKQNKNSSVVYRAAAAALTAVFLLCSFSLPSFADSTNQFSDACIVPYSSNYSNSSSSNIHYWDNGLIIGYSVDGSITTSVNALCDLPSADVYFFRVVVNGSNTQTCVVAQSTGSFNVGYRWMNSGSTVNRITPTLYTSNGITSSDNIYAGYRNNSFPSNWNSSIPVFSSFDAGVLAFKQYIDNANALGVPFNIAVTLKPGYVGYFDISDLSDVSVVLGTTLFSGAKYPGFSTSQAIGTVTSLPSGTFSLPITGTSSINWAGSGQKNLIGQYSNFAYRHTYTSVGGRTYLVVVNPLSGSAPTYSTLAASASNRNGNLTVLINQCRGSNIYSLTESISIGSSTPSYDVSSDGDPVNEGTYDPDTGSWSFVNPSTGLPEDPSQLPIGGGNDPIIGGTGGNTINDFLEDIANTIKSFFSGAIGAVTTLVSAGSAFINQLISLYSWLPAPVYSVLSSALVLVITIGVIKVFI